MASSTDRQSSGNRTGGNFFTRPFRQTAADIRDPNRSSWQRTGTALAVLLTWLALIPAGAVVYMLTIVPTAPSANELRRQTTIKPAIVLASDGSELTQFERDNRVWVPLDSVSRTFVETLLAVEDQRFYSHRGIDWHRAFGAGVSTVRGRTEGGSTITQQLARNMFPEEIGRALSIRRKLKEIITARRIERTHDKDQILEAYVNTVPFLYNAFGVEMAARTYFDTHANDLDEIQSATLVGMLKGTSYYNPVRHPERAEERRNLVLRLMSERGVVDSSELDSLQARPLGLDFERQPTAPSEAPHFTRYIREWLSEWADRNGVDLYADGLVIHTTLDPALQRLAEQSVRLHGQQLHDAAAAEWGGGFSAFWAQNSTFEERIIRRSGTFRDGVAGGRSESAMLDSIRADRSILDSLRAQATRLEVGFVALEPRTRYVRAWVGSRDYQEQPLDHVWKTRRQPGSVFKPFVYAAALSRGFLPGDTFVDEQTTIQVDRNRTWRPRNAGGAYTGQPMTLTEALAYSKNTVTAKLMMEVGPTYVASLARDMGIRESRLQPHPSLALGTSEVTLKEMATAYATLAAGGQYSEPVPVTRIEDRNGRVVAEFGTGGERAISQDVAQVVTHMLRGAIDRGTGRQIRSRFGVTADVAGKTGTSQNGADGWFILMHPNLVAGAWVGFPHPTVTFRTNQYGQGSRNALLVVGEFFRDAVSHIPEGRFETPARYQEAEAIWARADQWDADTEVWDDSLYVTQYDDFVIDEWDPDHDALDGLDLDDLDDLDQEETGAPDASGDDDTGATERDGDDGRTAVQRLYDEMGEDLDEDMGRRDDGQR
jgi:penicillin-binding protein 1A